ncbi:MAG: non-ribosomal peptide synthetase, partial [Aestuariivirga sp.]|uniref:non-ribosomal peptide synthetase n=1 Tax=Aestuariivirga sp. TaxID=2650926 RepID=UPI003019E00D
DEFVGVLVGRSAQLPCAFLAILKAGAVYVPMAADLPAERLCDMARQCGMRRLVVLDETPVPPMLMELLEKNAKEAGAGERILLRPEAGDAQSAATRPEARGTPQETAAVLFTSGSSGRPKGVLLSHASALNMVRGHMEAQRITSQDRFLLSSSPGFILGFRELCLPMAAGAAYVPASRALLDDPPGLIALMSHHKVTVALFTPSFLRLLDGAVPDGLRLIMTAGERPNADDARHYARRLEYWNMHGATEMCGTICMHRVDPGDSGAIPSGKPFLNTQVHLLDGAGNEVPPGETGEVYVTGLGLSRGYLGQPGLSARAFIETRYGRAYRTNDVGRFRPGDMLETLGRADDVVKISGQAVSLSEIEQGLLRNPLVSRAAAVLHEGKLIGFVEADPARAAGEDWRHFLSGFLPAYMLPAAVLAVPEMPTNSAGKTDRKSLVAIAEGASAGSRTAERAQLPVEGAERVIASAWEDVIGVKPVLRHDNFYAIGGTSLLSIAVSQKLLAAGLAITPQMILASLTVADLAARLGDWQQALDEPGANQLAGKGTLGQQDFWVAAELGMSPGASHITRMLRAEGAVPE